MKQRANAHWEEPGSFWGRIWFWVTLPFRILLDWFFYFG